MRDVLFNVLSERDDADLDVDGTNRILAAAFFRKRPLQAGTSPDRISMMSLQRATSAAPATLRAHTNNVVRLSDRRSAPVPSGVRDDQMLWQDESKTISGFLGGGKRR